MRISKINMKLASMAMGFADSTSGGLKQEREPWVQRADGLHRPSPFYLGPEHPCLRASAGVLEPVPRGH